MTHRVTFSPEAEAQLVALRRYLTREAGLGVARSFTDAIVAHCEGLDIFPDRGAPRDDIRPGLRILGFRRRVTIAYAVGADVVTILAVFYGGQDIGAALTEGQSSIRFARLEWPLDYFQANFSPYQFHQALVVEFPVIRGAFAEATPGTIPWSEGILFIADNRVCVICG